MSSRIQLRRDTAANWTAANPILASGELAVETAAAGVLPKLKVGDGVTAWNSLDYYVSGGGGNGGPAVDLSKLEGIQVHNGTTGGGTRLVGYYRVRWIGGATRPTNMAAGDIWETT